METMHEFVQRLNVAVMPLSGIRIDEMGADFHKPFRAIINPILPENFKIGLWGLTYIHEHFDITQNIIEFGCDLKQDRRTKGIVKGSLRGVYFNLTPKFITSHGSHISLDEYTRLAIKLSIEEKIHNCNEQW